MKNINQDEMSEVRYLENFIECTSKEMKDVKEENRKILEKTLAEKMKAYDVKHS